jgi:hypothetical protein
MLKTFYGDNNGTPGGNLVSVEGCPTLLCHFGNFSDRDRTIDLKLERRFPLSYATLTFSKSTSKEELGVYIYILLKCHQYKNCQPIKAYEALTKSKLHYYDRLRQAKK